MNKMRTLHVTEEQQKQVEHVIDTRADLPVEDLRALLMEGRHDENGEWEEGVGISGPIANIILFILNYPYEDEEDAKRKMDLYNMVLAEFSLSDAWFVKFLCNEVVNFAQVARNELEGSNNATKH